MRPSHAARPRAAALGAVALLMAGLLSGCGEGLYRTQLYTVQAVGGTPYLVVEAVPALPGEGNYQGTFSLYKPAAADFSAWTAVQEDLTGPVFGAFVYRDASGERLGIFHPGRITLWRFEGDEARSEAKLLPFKWTAETAAQLGNQLYVFGGQLDEASSEPPPRTGAIAVAVFDGQELKDLKLTGPALKTGPQQEFWIQAVTHAGKIHVFWRRAVSEPGLDLEAPVAFPGPLTEAVFDGQAFLPGEREYAGLPDGHPDVWSDGARLRVVVQPQERTVGHSPPLRVFTLPPEGDAVEEAEPAFEEPFGLHFKYFGVARIPAAGGREVFLRSNSQRFELWEAGPQGWIVHGQPQGLPEHNLERMFWGGLGLCVTLMALGVGLAVRRRRQTRLRAGRLRPQDVFAPLSLRVGAYLIDLLSLGLAMQGLTYVAGEDPGRWLVMLVEVRFLVAFTALYLGYLTLAEWRCGRTLGKWITGLRVVSDQGEPITLWAALARNLVGFFERQLPLVCFAAVPAILLTPRRQRVGDLLARTLVVDRAAFERYLAQRAADQAAEADAPAEPGTPPERDPPG